MTKPAPPWLQRRYSRSIESVDRFMESASPSVSAALHRRLIKVAPHGSSRGVPRIVVNMCGFLADLPKLRRRPGGFEALLALSVPQFAAYHLAGSGHGQGLDEFDLPRILVL